MRTPTSVIYYGWFVLAAGAIAEMLAQGATSYTAGLFVLPLQAEFHLSRADASSPVLILFAGSALASPLVGWLLDRHSIRLVMGGGALVFALSLVGVASTSSLWLMSLLLFFSGAAGFMAIGPLLTATLASRWFWRRRGLTLGLAAMATSGGGLLAPLVGAVVATYGWREGLLYEAIVLCIIIVALAALVVRDDPAQIGLDVHPENLGRTAVLPAASAGRWSVLCSASFWIPSLTLATISGTAQAAVTLIVPYARGLGHSPTQAALLITVFAIAAAATKVLVGLLADHVTPRLLLVAAPLCMALSWLTLSTLSGYSNLTLASALAGVALGCALPSVTAIVAAHFGVARFGSVMGATYFLILSFSIAAVRISGFVYDRTGSYEMSFEIFAVVLSILFLMTALFALRRRAS